MAEFRPPPPRWAMELQDQQLLKVLGPDAAPLTNEAVWPSPNGYNLVIKHYGEPVLTVEGARAVTLDGEGIKALAEAFERLNENKLAPSSGE